MNRFLALAILAALALAGTAKDKIVLLPPHCAIADEFYRSCPAAKRGGYDCPNVHISIKALPDCQQYDHQRFIQVRK